MTRRTNARIAGIAYLLYIAVAYPSMVLSDRATSGEGMAAKLANMALHATDVRLAAVLSLIGCFCALVLAVTLGLLAIATAAGTDAPDPGAARAVGAFVLNQSWFIAATFFAVGSTLFSWLLLRGRMVPVWLAGLGVIASAVVAVALPLQVTEVLTGLVTRLMWLPVAVFELVLAVWLIVKGAAAPEVR